MPIITHHMSNTRVYRIWAGMKSRCLIPTDTNYSRYGGRGITVCDRWLTFEHFYEDMGDCPEGLTLDRIETADGYCPDNCRWATYSTQGANRDPYRICRDGKYIYKRGNRWLVSIRLARGRQFNRNCATYDDAVALRDETLYERQFHVALGLI